MFYIVFVLYIAAAYAHQTAWVDMQAPPYAANYTGQAYAAYGSRLYEFGGVQDSNIYHYEVSERVYITNRYAHLRYYERDDNRWYILLSIGTFPAARSYACATVVGSTFYLLGGVAADGVTQLSDFWRIDLANTDAGWTQLTSLSTPQVSCRMVKWGHKILAGFGNSASSQLWTYTPSTATWAALAVGNSPSPLRIGGDIALLNNKLYLAGGDEISGDFFRTPVSDVWVLDLSKSTKIWTLLLGPDSLPEGNSFRASVVAGWKWHFHGGDGTKDVYLPSSRTSLYNFLTNKWTQSYLPGYLEGPAVTGMGCVTLDDGLVYCSGGYSVTFGEGYTHLLGSSSTDYQQQYTNTVWRYNPYNTWVWAA